jgi:ATP-dependent Zn protease
MGAIKYYADTERRAEFFEMAERAVALHEAGHAVVSVAVTDFVPDTVLIAAKHRNGFDRIVLGQCNHSFAIEMMMDTPEHIIAWAGIRLAGQCAESVFDKDHYRPSASEEIVQAQADLVRLGEAELGLSHDSALALFSLTQIAVRKILETNAAAVERVAAALIVRRKLYRPALFKLLDVDENNIGEWVLANVPR